MKIIITESQYNFLLSEQSSPKSKCVVWVDSKNDPQYIKYQNEYNMYMRGKSIVDYFKQNPNATNEELNKKEVELEKKYPVSKKFNIFGSERIKSTSMVLVGKGRATRGAPQYKKPTLHCIKPPKPTPPPTKQEPPKVNKPVAPTKPTTPTSTLDKTKPVDFYFGNRIFRAPTFDIAKRFAEKLALHNFNSNKVDVLKDKTNERWFVGYNDKIYLSQYVYNQDPNDPYVDPVKMGLISL
jgi:hypothetical protein